jgi:hypothetical protein
VTARELHARLAGGESETLLGLPLVPFSLGHARLLDFLGCSELRTAEEVALAAVVCSRPQEDVLPFLRSRLMPLRLAVWKVYLGAWDPMATRDSFVGYLKRHMELPMHVFKGSMAPCPIPGHQMIRTRLLSELNYRPQDIDSTPFLQAVWDIRTLDVMAGRVEMFDKTEEDQAAIEAAIDWDEVRKRGAKLMEANA